MRKILLATLIVALGAALTGCGGGIDELNDETYADIWLETYEKWDGEQEGAWDEALKEYGTSAEEYDAYTIELLEGDDARYTEVTKAIEDDLGASMAYFGYTMSVGLGGFGEDLGTAMDESMEGLGDMFGDLEAGINEGLEEASEAMGEAVDEAEGAMEEAAEGTEEEDAQ
jgi:ABC-type glycerol-3-phosphate transport system substrate-binding protein